MTQLDDLQESTRHLTEQVEQLCVDLGEGGLKGEIDIIAADVVQIKKIRGRALVYFVLAVLCSLIAFAAAGLIARHEIHAVQVDRVQACVDRNAQSSATAASIRAQFIPALAREAARPKPDPVLLSILQELANYQPVTVPCD